MVRSASLNALSQPTNTQNNEDGDQLGTIPEEQTTNHQEDNAIEDQAVGENEDEQN